MLVVSHDRFFLDRICDQIVAFEDGGVFVQPGNFSYYLEKRQERELREKLAWGSVAKAHSSQPETATPKPSRPRKLTFKEQRELADMERAILAVEARVAELETILNDPGFYITRSREAAGLIADLEAGKADVARLYERWHELDQIGK